MTIIAKKKPISKKLQKILDDFPLFCKNFIKIIDNNNDLIRLELNDAQLDIHELSKSNRFIAISKARQGGISTYTVAKAIYRAITKPNENILIVSYKEDSATALFNMAKRMNDNLPRDKFPHIFPKVKRDNRGELFFDNGSRITSTTAGNKDIGRGSTYSFIHLSEAAFFADLQVQLLSAEQSLMKGEGSNLTIETTSNGLNFWHSLFMKSYKGDSKYKAYFIPWYHKLYAKQFKFDYDEAERWHKAHYDKRLTAKDLENDEKVYHKDGATLKQLMWRRWKLLDMQIEGFKQEFPANPMESFISTGESVFDPAKVLEAYNHLLTPMGKKDLLEVLPASLQRYIGKGLDVFHLPKSGQRYYGGVDTASGGGGDMSTISIFDSDGQQVFSFYNKKVPVYVFAEIINTIGHLYNYAFLCVERNSYGNPILERLRKEYGYLNLYKQKIFNNGKKQLQLGFQTSVTTKSVLISDFKEQFERGFINVECKETLGQMQIYQERSNGSMGNKRGDGNHDDLVISAGLSVQAMKANKWYV